MSKRIMVVDDEPDTVDLVKLVLETEGFEVITAYSGDECLKKLHESLPDAVLLDIMMPEMDGWKYSKRSGKSSRTCRGNAHCQEPGYRYNAGPSCAESR